MIFLIYLYYKRIEIIKFLGRSYLDRVRALKDHKSWQTIVI